MDKELKAKWVKALRSGEFKQGTGVLYDGSNERYCCLGVLSCIATGQRGEPGAYGYTRTGGYILASKQLGSDVAKKLQHMNDGHDMPQHSFAEIAAYIEANL